MSPIVSNAGSLSFSAAVPVDSGCERLSMLELLSAALALIGCAHAGFDKGVEALQCCEGHELSRAIGMRVALMGAVRADARRNATQQLSASLVFGSLSFAHTAARTQLVCHALKEGGVDRGIRHGDPRSAGFARGP
ncbi:hypothetical protein HLV38_01540 [Berryella wangjianweii]|uniref:Uncharacterized protein n=1 Tax=Berryella wangjianweii TaxID=2734634 RepID=A0A6M8IZ04_9ACTN|nr:hypothetical protein [Berryella wangjianweii]QKF06950.1 hypothetical protein HLV38_01540 [Berryella wangjianweii]